MLLPEPRQKLETQDDIGRSELRGKVTANISNYGWYMSQDDQNDEKVPFLKRAKLIPSFKNWTSNSANKRSTHELKSIKSLHNIK